VRVERALGVLVGLWAVLASGCSLNPNQGLQTAPAAETYDINGFVCEAMPVLIRHCSYLGCHGNAQHALRIYSPGKLRASDVVTRADRDASLTAAEVEANFDSATGVLLAGKPPNGQSLDLQTAPLLQKPLRAAFGGDEHHGVGIFPFPPATTLAGDPEWNALLGWAAGGKEPKPLSSDCANLFMAIGVSPK
jgi:hypothetical protein